MRIKKLLKTLIFSLFFIPQLSLAARDLIRIGIQLEPPVLDPTITASASAGVITYNNIFEGLTKIDRDAKVRPLLARSWQISNDGLEYSFELQRGVTFHDGSSFDADTVAFSLQRIQQGKKTNPQQELFSMIDSVRVIDRYTVKVTLSEPDSAFLFNLALPAAIIVHPDTVITNKDRPIGTGPYRFISWAKEDRLSMEVFSDYWGKKPAIDKALFIFTPSRVEINSALADGLVDGYRDASGHGLLQKFASRSDYKIVESIGEGEIILAINNARAPFSDIRVRQALAYAINKQVLADDPDFNNGVQIGSHFSPHHPAYIDLSDRYSYDPEKAKALLAQAGLEHGFELRIAAPSTSYAQIGAFYIASQFEEIGLKAEPQRMVWSEWMQRVFTDKDYDVTIISHIEPFDIHIYAKDNYYFNYNNKKFKALWRQIRHTQDKKTRYQLLGEAQRMLSDDCVNVFLFMKEVYGIWKSNLGGVWQSSVIPAVVVSDMYWRE